ncbi:MAG: EF-Tu/IF-2/RF-3 family GTPase, partial [Myxococcota bacterium]|nr:EF-Tu/IF-2/RF-3 family GTPase [Myxococcota bacterium]
DHCIAVHLPIGAESEFSGIVDLVEMEAIEWPDPNDPRELVRGPVPEHMAEDAEIAREALLERIALEDEDFAEQYLEDTDSLTTDQIHQAIRRATLGGNLVPVMAGSALRNKGIQPLLQAIVNWLPSPADVPAIEGVDPRNDQQVTRDHDSKAPVSALAYKVAIMEDGRRMVFVRLYSGTMSAGQPLYNPALGITEKPSRIFLMHANNRERMERIGAGNIFGVLGLKKTRTGDTVCAPDEPILLESIDAYEPVISQAVEPDTLREKEKLEISLGKLADEDPTFQWHEDEGTGQTIIRGMGELHLDILVDRLKREFGVEVRVGRPQVVYRETISGEANVAETFERGGEEGDNIFGSVTLSLSPRTRGDGNKIDWSWPPAEAPAWFGPEVSQAVEDGINQALQSGALEG